MTDFILVIPGLKKPRHVPPPLPPDGGGFYYLKRDSDGAVLLTRDGKSFRQFDDEIAARSYAAAHYAMATTVCFMPKLRTN